MCLKLLLEKALKIEKRIKKRKPPANPSPLSSRPGAAQLPLLAQQPGRPARARSPFPLSADGQAPPPFSHRQPDPTRQSLPLTFPSSYQRGRAGLGRENSPAPNRILGSGIFLPSLAKGHPFKPLSAAANPPLHFNRETKPQPP